MTALVLVFGFSGGASESCNHRRCHPHDYWRDALLFGGFSYTKREKILDVGPIEATTERRETIAVPPILGGLAVAGGLALLFVGARRKGT